MGNHVGGFQIQVAPKLFGNTTSKKVTPSVGPEQEYFLVDRQKYLKRKDLIFTGRTLFGAMPPKGRDNGPVVVLARAVYPCKGLFVEQAG